MLTKSPNKVKKLKQKPVNLTAYTDTMVELIKIKDALF